MQKILLLLVCLAVFLPTGLVAQDGTLDLNSALNLNSLILGDSLTNSITGFVHANWSQAGIGIVF